jgi:hypothetical protein
MLRWFLLACLAPALALAHGGRTDKYGCHNSKSGYHCHGGGSTSSGGSSSSATPSPPGPGFPVVEVYTLNFLSLSAGTDKAELEHSNRYASVVNGQVQAVDKLGRRATVAVSDVRLVRQQGLRILSNAEVLAQADSADAGVPMAGGDAGVPSPPPPATDGGVPVKAKQKATTKKPPAAAAPQPDPAPPAPSPQRAYQPAPDDRLVKVMVGLMLGCPMLVIGAGLVFLIRSLARPKLLDRTAPTPASEPPPDEGKWSSGDPVFYKLLVRLTSARGPAERKSILARAEQLNDPKDRLQLLLEASKLDTEQVLDRVAGLTSKEVRLRRLKAAIDALIADAVPDHMQAAQLSMLREAYRVVLAEPD